MSTICKIDILYIATTNYMFIHTLTFREKDETRLNLKYIVKM